MTDPGRDLRSCLCANLFDGDDGGEVTSYKISTLLDDIVVEVALWVMSMSGVEDKVEKYYLGDDSD